MLKRYWDSFMCSNGIRRSFNPKKWERGTPILVFGEFAALVTALTSVWFDGRLPLSLAAIFGAGALLWYALDKSSLGEMPLTGTSARRIRAVANLVKVEDMHGQAYDWDTISGDGTSISMDITKLKPEVKLQMGRNLMRIQLRNQNPGMTQEQVEQAIGTLSESEVLRIMDEMGVALIEQISGRGASPR